MLVEFNERARSAAQIADRQVKAQEGPAGMEFQAADRRAPVSISFISYSK